MNNKDCISVIIPCFNQYESLLISLKTFSMQTLEKNKFEMIIIDDGSIDETRLINEKNIYNDFGLNSLVIHTSNQGRAKARNEGIKVNNNSFICFCDSDRFVCPDFLEQHLTFLKESREVVVGQPLEYFGSKRHLVNNDYDWQIIKKLSKRSYYYNKIRKIYCNEQTKSNLAWLSFLVGNSSVESTVLEEVGGFNNAFVEWGFEHFEMALRMQKNNVKFFLNERAMSFHIQHKRVNDFYEINVRKNAEIINKMYPCINKNSLIEFMLYDDDISKFEYEILGEE